MLTSWQLNHQRRRIPDIRSPHDHRPFDHQPATTDHCGSDDVVATTGRPSGCTRQHAGDAWWPNTLPIHHHRCKRQPSRKAGHIHPHWPSDRTSLAVNHGHRLGLLSVVIHGRNIHSTTQRRRSHDATGNRVVLFRSNFLGRPRRRCLAHRLLIDRYSGHCYVPDSCIAARDGDLYQYHTYIPLLFHVDLYRFVGYLALVPTTLPYSICCSGRCHLSTIPACQRLRKWVGTSSRSRVSSKPPSCSPLNGPAC